MFHLPLHPGMLLLWELGTQVSQRLETYALLVSDLKNSQVFLHLANDH